MAEGQRAYLTHITDKGFSIVLPDLAIHDYTYNWSAIAVSNMTTTKSTSVLGTETQPVPDASPSAEATESGSVTP